MLQPKHLPHTVSKIMTDKRDTERVSAVFSAIIMKDGAFHCHCIIRDVSVSGMKLELPEDVHIPDQFELKTPAMEQQVHMRTAWRSGDSAGVEFIQPEETYTDEPEQDAAYEPEQGAA